VRLGRLRIALAGRALWVAVALLLAVTAWAEDSAVVETSTYVDSSGVLVITPTAKGTVDLGEQFSLGAKLTVDAVSAASWRVDGVSGATYGVGEWRKAGNLSAAYDGDENRASVFVDHGIEDDWRSTSFGVGLARDLAQRCFTVALSWYHTYDQILPARIGYDVEDDVKHTDSGRLTLSQILTPTSVVSGTYELIAVRGLQASPYYVDVVSLAEDGPTGVGEATPRLRMRQSVRVRLDQFLPIEAAAHPALRLYTDDWGIRSVTGELGYGQRLGQTATLGLRGRVYAQSAASWWVDRDELAVAGDVLLLDHRYDAYVSHLEGVSLKLHLDAMLAAMRVDGPDQLVLYGGYDLYHRVHDDWVLQAHLGRVGLQTVF
jgi:hypothetical protein